MTAVVVFWALLAATPAPASDRGAPPAPVPVTRGVQDGAQIISVAPAGRRDGPAAADDASLGREGDVARAASTTVPPAYWETIGHWEDDWYPSVNGMAAGGRKVLVSRSDGGYYVLDRDRRTEQRVDVVFDGHPITEQIRSAAISGDGGTVAFLLVDPDTYEASIRFNRLDGSENFTFDLPDAGEQTWSSGWVEQCSWLTDHRPLRLSHDGNVASFLSEPCYYDRIFAVDVSGTPRWQAGYWIEPSNAGVLANGTSFWNDGDWCRDENWSGRCDSGEHRFSDIQVVPIRWDGSGAIGNGISWPWDARTTFCSDLPIGSRAQPDATGSRFAFTSDQVGLDPDTIVYSSGQQLYYADRGCVPRSLGRATGYDGEPFRMADDGRSVAQEAHKEGDQYDYGHLRITDVPSGAVRDFTWVYTGDYYYPTVHLVDPLITTVARGDIVGDSDKHAGVIRAAQLSGTPRALKVAVVGDSYIAGEGAFSYEPGTDRHAPVKNTCHRSVGSWAYQLGQRLAAFRINGDHPQLKSFACSGAVTDQIVRTGQYDEGNQVDALDRYDKDGRPVDIVFLSAGGNDAGFKDVVVTCLALRCLQMPGWKGKVLADVRQAGANVAAALRKIKAAAPHATVFLTGYPSIVDPPDGSSCASLGMTESEARLLSLLGRGRAGKLVDLAGGFKIDEGEQRWLGEEMLANLNRELHRAAVDTGVHFIDPTGWFRGHGVCSADPFGNGVTPGDDLPEFAPIIGQETFHPNPRGYDRMALRIEAGFGDDFRPDNNPPPAPQGLDAPADEVGFVVVDGELRAWGDRGRVSVQGLPDGTRVVLGQFGRPAAMGTATVGPDGTAQIDYEIPDGLYPGLHRLVVYDQDSGEALGGTFMTVAPPEGCRSSSEPDRDEDELPDRCDADLVDGPSADGDGDGVPNLGDVCPSVADPDQGDSDGDGQGDACAPGSGFHETAALAPFPEPVLPRPRPTVSFDGAPAATQAQAAVAFTLSSAELPAPTLTATCRLDGGAAAPCTSPVQVSGLAEGRHTLEVLASSDTGVSSDPTRLEWWVDVTAPTLNVSTPSSSTARSVALYFTSYDARDTPSTTCALDDGPAAACTSPARYTDLTVGPHTATVVATDAAGNEARQTVRWEVRTPTAPPAPTGPTTTPRPPRPAAVPTALGTLPEEGEESGAAVTTPVTATALPRIMQLRLRPARFRAARSGPAVVGRRVRTGTVLTLRTQAGALLRITAERRAGRAWHRAGRLDQQARTAVVRLVLSGRFGGRRLAPGSYRLRVTARVPGGPDGPAALAAFRVLR